MRRKYVRWEVEVMGEEGGESVRQVIGEGVGGM